MFIALLSGRIQHCSCDAGCSTGWVRLNATDPVAAVKEATALYPTYWPGCGRALLAVRAIKVVEVAMEVDLADDIQAVEEARRGECARRSECEHQPKRRVSPTISR